MQLSSAELVRRFALHVLPKGFMRVRYFGFLANPVRRKKLKEIRNALLVAVPLKPKEAVEVVHICPNCGERSWVFIGAVTRWHWQPG